MCTKGTYLFKIATDRQTYLFKIATDRQTYLFKIATDRQDGHLNLKAIPQI